MVFEAKSDAEIVERTYEVPTLDDDSLASFVYTATGVTVDATETIGDTITFTLSAGTTGETPTIAVTATTTNGLIVTETLYQPIRGDGFAFSYTAREVCSMALRKVVGLGSTATASELDDALERLSDMLASWAAEGADLSVKLPCAANDVLYVPDWTVEAIKANLTVDCAELYDAPVGPRTAAKAYRGLQRVKSAYLPEDRPGSEFY